jgi:hypothetical protein
VRVRGPSGLLFRERRAVLDLETLRPHGKVSFIPFKPSATGKPVPCSGDLIPCSAILSPCSPDLFPCSAE